LSDHASRIIILTKKTIGSEKSVHLKELYRFAVEAAAPGLQMPVLYGMRNDLAEIVSKNGDEGHGKK
jgi:hypothetical protein